MTPTFLDRLVRILDRALLVLASIGLLAMMLHICADILGSLLFNRPIAVTNAFVTQFYMIAVAFLPFFATELRGAHIGITLLTDHLPRRARRVQEAFVHLLSAGVAVMLTLQAWDQATDKLAVGAYMVEQTSRIIVWPSFFIVVAGFGALALLLTLRALLALTGRAQPGLLSSAPDGAPNV